LVRELNAKEYPLYGGERQENFLLTLMSIIFHIPLERYLIFLADKELKKSCCY
jgi:hypothetical protein